MMAMRFVCEPIRPVEGTINVGAMARGEPGFPGRFVWRDEEYTVADVLKQWKETSPCSHGGAEQYVRKHWFDVRTADGGQMKIYFERQARSKRERTARWWLHSIATPDPE